MSDKTEVDSFIELVAADDVKVNVPGSLARRSGTLSNLLDDIENNGNASIPLPGIAEGVTLERVVKFMTDLHTPDFLREQKVDSDGKSEETKAAAVGPKKWRDFTDIEKAYLNMPAAEIFKLMEGANYLAYRELLGFLAKYVADMIKGKSVEELRVLFNVVNDFTPEEEEKIRKENSWVEDVKEPVEAQ